MSSHHQFHTHHDDGDGTSGMRRGQTEHHVSMRQRQSEADACQITRNHLTHRTDYHHAAHDVCSMPALKQRPDINEHTHTDQEIRNEDGIADEFNPSHQR